MPDHANQSPLPRMAPRERNRKLPLIALFYGLGIWTAEWTREGMWALWLLLVAALFWAALKLWHKPCFAALLPVCMMVGILITQPLLQPAIPQTGAYDSITASVYGDPMPRSNGRVALVLTDVVLDGEPQPGKAYLTLQLTDTIQADALFDGAALRMRGSVYRPMGKQNQYDFDFRMWLLQNGIGYGISGAREVTLQNTRDSAPWKDVAARIRALCAARLERFMGAESALAMGMLLGERDALPEEQQAAFRRAGVMHLMAVSGLHVGLMAAALAWLFGRFYIRKAIRLPLIAMLIILYCALTGFSPATVRATAMVSLLLLAQATGRKVDPLTLLSAAALIVLLLNPLDLFSAGFVLSFSAMAGILLLSPPLLAIFHGGGKANRSKPKSGKADRFLQRLRGKPRELLVLTLAAQLGVWLPCATYFHAWPLYGIVFNMLAVPLAGLFVPLYAAVLLVSLLPLIGGLLGVGLGWIAQLGSKLLLWVVSLSASLPFAQVRIPSPGIWAYAFAALCMVAVSQFVHASMKRRLLALSLAGCIALTGYALTRPAQVRYHQMAVGQADAALMIDGRTTIAVDVGAYGSEIAARLLAEGRDVDALILTHLHSDHAQGVTALFAQDIDIRQAYLPMGAELTAEGEEGYAILMLLAEQGVPITTLSAGDKLSFGETSVEVLWPDAESYRAGRSVNDMSLVTLLRLGDLRILSMADVSENYDRYIATACDVLKVGHHGSADGTGDGFLDMASPRLALVTVRENAALPSPETKSRLAAHDVHVLRTDLTGEIIIQKQAEGYRIQTYKAGVINEP